MDVYVDNLRPSLRKRNWPYGKSCHLVADSVMELNVFASKIGLKPFWFQNKSSLPHYDLTENMRKKAIRFGAVEITDTQLAFMIRNNKQRLKALTIKSDAGSRQNNVMR